MATPSDQHILEEVFSRRLLSKYGALAGNKESTALQHDWAAIVDEIQTKWREIGRRNGPIQKKPDDAALVAAGLLSITTPAFVDEVKSRADQWLRQGARDCSWLSTFGESVADLLVVGIVGGDAIAEIERVRAETAAAEQARRLEQERIARESQYQQNHQALGSFAGASAGALAGLVVGFIPCWIVSGFIGFVFGHGQTQSAAGWNSFWWLWIASMIFGVVSMWQTGRNWVASASREPSEVIVKGLLIGGTCSLLSVVFIGHLVGETNPVAYIAPSSAINFTEVRVAQSVENGQPVGLTASFTAPASPSLYIRYVNANANSDRISVSVWSNGQRITSCTDFTLIYQSGNYWCTLNNSLSAADYAFQVAVNGQTMGSYPFTISQ